MPKKKPVYSLRNKLLEAIAVAIAVGLCQELLHHLSESHILDSGGVAIIAGLARGLKFRNG